VVRIGGTPERNDQEKRRGKGCFLWEAKIPEAKRMELGVSQPANEEEKRKLAKKERGL